MSRRKSQELGSDEDEVKSEGGKTEGDENKKEDEKPRMLHPDDEISVESAELIQKYKVDKSEEVKTATTTKIEATPTTTTNTPNVGGSAPKIPWRSSSKQIVKEKLAAQRSSPSLSLVNVMISTAEPKNITKSNPEKLIKREMQPEEQLPPIPPLPVIVLDEPKKHDIVNRSSEVFEKHATSTEEFELAKKIELSESERCMERSISSKQKSNGNWKASKGEIERKLREQEEQEKRFKARLKVEQRYKETRAADTSDDTSSASLCYQPHSLPVPYNPNPPPIPPPPELGPPSAVTKKPYKPSKEEREQALKLEKEESQEEIEEQTHTEQRKRWDEEEKERMEAKRLCVQQLHQIKSESKQQNQTKNTEKEEMLSNPELELIRAQELKELQRLREMERRKQAIEEEIAREKQHLIDLQLLELDSIEKTKNYSISKPKAAVQYEAMVAKRITRSSPLPPPPSPRTHFHRAAIKQMKAGEEAVYSVAKMTEAEAREQMQHELKSLHELKILEEKKRIEIEELKRQSESEEHSIQQSLQLKTKEEERIERQSDFKHSLQRKTNEEEPPSIEKELSLEDTIKDLETTTNQLKEFAERHCPDKESLDSIQGNISNDRSSIHSFEENKVTEEVQEQDQPEAATADEIKDAAGAVREVAHALLKALTPTPEQSADDQYPVPEGIVKNVKNALQKLEEIPPSPNFQKRVIAHDDDTGYGRRSVEIEEELKEIKSAGKVKSTASIFKSNSASDHRTCSSSSTPRKLLPPESPKPSRRIGNLFKVEHKKWSHSHNQASNQHAEQHNKVF